jgi:hypothetical protein
VLLTSKTVFAVGGVLRILVVAALCSPNGVRGVNAGVMGGMAFMGDLGDLRNIAPPYLQKKKLIIKNRKKKEEVDYYS